MSEYISYLPHLNACLNGTSALLLLPDTLLSGLEMWSLTAPAR